WIPEEAANLPGVERVAGLLAAMMDGRLEGFVAANGGASAFVAGDAVLIEVKTVPPAGYWGTFRVTLSRGTDARVFESEDTMFNFWDYSFAHAYGGGRRESALATDRNSSYAVHLRDMVKGAAAAVPLLPSAQADAPSPEAAAP